MVAARQTLTESDGWGGVAPGDETAHPGQHEEEVRSPRSYRPPVLTSSPPSPSGRTAACARQTARRDKALRAGGAARLRCGTLLAC